MTKVVRPIRFDNVRRERRNAKRRTRDREKREQRRKRYRFFNRLFWFDIEPEAMWDNTDFDGNGANDNGV
jgi:hypothetical protein